MSSRHPQRRQVSIQCDTPQDDYVLRRSKIATAIVLALSGGHALAATAATDSDTTQSATVAPAAPQDMEFDSSFLVGESAKSVDLSRFEHGNVVLPGVYAVDVTVVDGATQRRDITFRAQPGEASAVPCFDRAMLTDFGVDWGKLAQALSKDGKPVDPASILAQGPLCASDLSTVIPDSTVQYDAAEQQMQVGIPQAYMSRSARGWVDPSQWDNGVTAATLAYNANLYQSTSGGQTYRNGYLGVDAGFNIDAWHVRHSGFAQWSPDTGASYSNSATYAQRDFPLIRGQLTLGQTTTDGTLFDGSVRILGAQLASDDRMLPRSQRGFAPIIRGVADSNARVTIRQNGIIIYETTVAAGPFVIDDLYPTGQSGDLEVTITEADGRQKTFMVPFSGLPQLLRPGQSRYTFSAGQIDMPGLRTKPYVFQAGWQQGLSNAVTGYGGVTASDGYAAAMLGMALNTPVGAFNVDLTEARTLIPNGPSLQGRSLRIGYNHTIESIGTTFTMAAYRYSSRGYLDLDSALVARDAALGGLPADYPPTHSRFNVNINQSLGDRWGYVYVNGSMERYWGGGSNTTYSAGYSNRFGRLSYALSVQRTREFNSPTQGTGDWSDAFSMEAPGSRSVTQVMLTLSIPLGKTAHAPNFSTNVSHDTQAGAMVQSALTGTLGDRNQFAYGTSFTRQTQQGDNSYSANAQYEGRDAIVGGSAGHSSDSNQLGLQVSGGVVIHPDGVTLANRLGDTMAIVHATGAEGASVGGSSTNVRLDSHGNAIAPFLLPYEPNTITLDPSGLPLDLELKDSSQIVAPHAGAIVLLNYRTVIGRTVLINSKVNGKPLPFGADVTDEKGNTVGIVGQASRIVARGLNDEGRLTVSWGRTTKERCVIRYRLPPVNRKSPDSGYQQVTAQCMTNDSFTAPHQASVMPGNAGMPDMPATDIAMLLDRKSK
jgi:outer membrane usher protein